LEALTAEIMIAVTLDFVPVLKTGWPPSAAFAESWTALVLSQAMMIEEPVRTWHSSSEPTESADAVCPDRTVGKRQS
jgi:hypothetical protein